MAITTDCAEGRHEVCRGAGPNHYCPQTAHLGDQKCACRCHEAARSPQDEDHETGIEAGEKATARGFTFATAVFKIADQLREGACPPDAPVDMVAQGWRLNYLEAQAALDRVRDARGDEEPEGVERELLRTIDQQAHRISEQEDRISNLLGDLTAARSPQGEDQ